MKIYQFVKILLLFVCLLELVLTCQYDWQCGNNQPFSQCSHDAFDLLTGIGYDDSLDRVILLGKFNGITSNANEPPYIASLPGNGGSPLQGDYPIITDSTTIYHRTQALIHYDQTLKLVYLEAAQYNSYGVGPYFSSNNSFVTTWRTTNLIPFGMYVDESTGDTYTCEYYLQRKAANGTSIEMLLQPVRCNHITRIGEKIYYVDQSGMYSLNRDCNQCRQADLVIRLPFYTTAFARSSSAFYFGVTHSFGTNYTGIWQLPIDRASDISYLKKIHSSSTHGLIFNRDAIKMFAATEDHQVLRFEQLDTTNPTSTTIYNHNQTTEGSCRCRSKFSGTDCRTCNPGTVRWLNGIPECVIKGTGPISCLQDYECKYPYGYCSNGYCKCQNDLTFSDTLDRCDCFNGTISWDNNGLPKCSK
ncbi:hypothetical protein PPL_00584 [Heterostelium album PN500]|uniref:EGF-like domain-containing protein n=1 Tax=Heterostelium pallidum (strain ATCC 26659 / Pp 5 / PN500) TaxID=670386 RepID=D3AWV6_HETP5|nr:hypothetical protein PPL_00584 [Heterostelium album PN500]EFA86779.1 hypothetical protein PPL_00584 [Heterostelium album PN500]|eukprot:XP_020438883.1 hypothetical protein PPL_00584 [Heterostelium album PN500]